MNARMADVLLIGTEWPTRALLRAQLIEEGYDVDAVEDWLVAARVLRSLPLPRAVVIDLQGLPEPREVLDDLQTRVAPHDVVVIAALGTMGVDDLRARGYRVVARPAAVGQIVAATADVIAKGGLMAMVTTFTLSSSAFKEGDVIPTKHTCDGADTPPPLDVSGTPEQTRSFALIMDDPDAPRGTFTHWVAYDVPAGDGSLDAHRGQHLKNSFGRSGYGGPCPPPGHGPHRYYFRLYAVDVPSLAMKGQTRQDLEEALKAHTLATAQLMGRYERR